jgi:hypothetical protein
VVVAVVAPFDHEKVFPVPFALAVKTVEAPSQKFKFPEI